MDITQQLHAIYIALIWIELAAWILVGLAVARLWSK